MEVVKARGSHNDLNDRLEADKINVNNAIETEKNTRINSNNNLQSQINGLASGSPLVASSTSEMTDKNRVYVNTSDGHWYWYNESIWKDGGVYQATGFADGSITQEKTTFAKRFNLISNSKYKLATITDNGKTNASSTVGLFGPAIVENLEKISYITRDVSGGTIKYFDNTNAKISEQWINANSYGTLSVPENTTKIYFQAIATIKENFSIVSGEIILDKIYDDNYFDFNSYDYEKFKNNTNLNIENLNSKINNFVPIYKENPEEIIWNDGGYLNQNGTATINNSYSYSDFIPVSPGELFKISGSFEFATKLYCMYNSNQILINKYPEIANAPYNSFETVEIEIPEGVSFIKLGKRNDLGTSLYLVDYYQDKNIVDVVEKTKYINDFTNKTILFSGDSICYGAGERENGGYSQTGWVKRFTNEFKNATVKGYGIGGTTIAKQEDISNSILERLTTMYSEYPNADYIILQGRCE